MTPEPPGPPARALYRIRDPRQIQALVSAVRQEIVDGLQTLGPCSIRELARRLARAPDSLYYHVRLLERAGLVIPRGRRGRGPSEEVLYDVPGRLALDHEPAQASERDSVVRLVASALRLAERELRAALDSGRAVFRRTSRRNAWGARSKGWLTRAELSEVRGHLEAVARIVQQGRPRRGALLCSVTFVLAPLAPAPRAQPSNEPGSP